MRAFPSGAKAVILADAIGTAEEVAEKSPGVGVLKGHGFPAVP